MSENAAPTQKRRYTTPIELADLDFATAKVTRRLNIFVAGPYIEKGWTENTTPKPSESAILRIYLADYVQNQLGHSAVFGEHRGVEELAQDHLRTRASPVLVELSLVKKNCDAVIVLPSSPGSYAELAVWSMYEDVSRKMLILADNRFEGKGGYLGIGVFKTACDHGATLKWVDYSDLREASEITLSHINKIQDSVLARSIIND